MEDSKEAGIVLSGLESVLICMNIMTTRDISRRLIKEEVRRLVFFYLIVIFFRFWIALFVSVKISREIISSLISIPPFMKLRKKSKTK